MRIHNSSVGYVSVATALSIVALAVVGCGQAAPYGDADHGSDPVPHEDGPTDDPAAGTKAGGSAASSGGSSTPSKGTAPAPSNSRMLLEEGFETGTPIFKVDTGTLTVIADGNQRVARLCADSAGNGSISAAFGPILSGTYEVSAVVRQDPTTPASTWILDATSYTPTPSTIDARGTLSATASRVVKTTVLGSAFSTLFAVSLGTAPGTCMIVDDIHVLYTP